MRKIYFLLVTLFVTVSCQKKEEEVYPYLVEYLVTGDASPVTILYTKESGVKDSIQVTLPYQVRLSKISNQLSSFEARKTTSAGSLSVETLYKGQSKDKRTTTANRGRVSVKSDDAGIVVSSDYQPESWPCSTYNGNQLITGPKGGCYYINGNGNQTYVDRSFCNCN